MKKLAMSMIKNIIWACGAFGLVALLCTTPLYAAQRAEKPFDASIEKLPANFSGNNIKTLYAAIIKHKKGFAKSEFESTEDYKRRMESIEKKRLTGNINFNSKIAIVAPLSKEYNADTKKLDLEIKNQIFIIDDTNFRSKNGSFNKRDTYSVSAQQEVALNKQIEISPNQAPLAKKSAVALLIGKLKYPYAQDDITDRTDYINGRPERVNLNEYSVYIDLEEIWLFDNKTGEIYLKKKISE